MEGLSIRQAIPRDAGILAKMIMELARYERLEAEATPNAVELARHLSPHAQAQAYALIAEEKGNAIGCAIYYLKYSTFKTRWNIHLEDLIVRSEYRGKGAGKILLAHLATIAAVNGCRSIDFQVLDWNDRARRLYEACGAARVDGWETFRFDRSAIERLKASL